VSGCLRRKYKKEKMGSPQNDIRHSFLYNRSRAFEARAKRCSVMVCLENLRADLGVLQNTMEHCMGSSTGRDVELVSEPAAAESRGHFGWAERREMLAMLRH
jgi:hypothetical protein